jgi:MarR family transcriptional regulator, organic hydroperoxide resistance regulator
MHRAPHLPAVPLEGLDPLSMRVYEAFMRVLAAHRQLMFRVLAEENAHPGQAICLRILAERDGISQRELARGLHLSAPTVTTMLQRMEKAGTIERRPDATDQRVTRVCLTGEGRARERNLRAVLGAVIARVLDPIPEADRRELERLLGVMADRADGALE